MKRKFLSIFAGALFLPVLANAQFAIDWFTLDGGGGVSSGGNFSLTGTIGQPDVGALSGGTYTLQGGFWPGIVVPATGEAPTLLIRVSGASVVILWSSTSGFSLEQSSTLLPGSWAPAPVAPKIQRRSRWAADQASTGSKDHSRSKWLMTKGRGTSARRRIYSDFGLRHSSFDTCH